MEVGRGGIVSKISVQRISRRLLILYCRRPLIYAIKLFIVFIFVQVCRDKLDWTEASLCALGHDLPCNQSVIIDHYRTCYAEQLWSKQDALELYLKIDHQLRVYICKMSTAVAILDQPARFPWTTSTQERTEPSDLTKLFEAVLRRGDSEMVTVRELLGGLETSAFGIPLAALAVPEIIPVPIPGVSLVISIPTAMIGAQMVTARERIWLPKSLLDRQIPAKPLKRAVRAMLPLLRKIDGVTRPRASMLHGKAGQRIVGVAIIILALLIALPIPGTNAPLALTVFILAIGLIRRDGLLIAAGLLLTAASAALMAGAALVLAEWMFGALVA